MLRKRRPQLLQPQLCRRRPEIRGMSQRDLRCHAIQDFGLARTLAHRGDTLPSLAPADRASVVTTHGYVAPEYATTGV